MRNLKKFVRVYGHVLGLQKYRHASQWKRYIVRNKDDNINEDLTLILYKSLEETTQEIYHRLSSHPAFIGATTHPHYLYHKHFFDKLLSKDVDSKLYSKYGDITPNMENYTVKDEENGDVVIECKE